MSQFTDELLNRVSIATVIGKRVSWDQQRSRPAAGNYWACCPFHKEQTPSFHVDDQKGVYYCFGCHESGNAITFVCKTENLESRDAIRFLADSVGMKVPALSERQEQQEAIHKSLFDICEQAAGFFKMGLKSQAGRAARDYLAKRGLSETILQKFEIGFALDGRSNLTQHFTGKGISLDALIAAGLSAKPDGNGAPYDRFRNRIIFPIRNARRQMIGFGGRTLDPKARAKYLNSPETQIFKKGFCLYNHTEAHKALKESVPLVVTEGYMDVIALSQSGIGSCVAPLGTAITESQVRQLWKLSAEPVLALDGDQAGLKAAERASRLALTLLEPGKSLRFCFLPRDTDPDDFVREHGGRAMLELIGRAMPLSDFVWQTEFDQQDHATPEGSAAFEAAVRAAAATIQDLTVRRQYDQYFRNKLYELSRSNYTKKAQSTHQRKPSGVGPSAELRASLLAAGNREEGIEQFIRECVVLGICLTSPQILPKFLERFENIEFSREIHQQILDCMVSHIGVANEEPETFRDIIRETFGLDTVDKFLQLNHLLPLHSTTDSLGEPPSRSIANRAEMMLTEELNKVEAENAARQELKEVRLDAKEGVGRNPMQRIGEVVELRQKAQRGIKLSETTQCVTAENGVLIDPQELEEFNQLVKDIDH